MPDNYSSLSAAANETTPTQSNRYKGLLLRLSIAHELEYISDEIHLQHSTRVMSDPILITERPDYGGDWNDLLNGDLDL